MQNPQKRRLGRGLAALIGDDILEAVSPEEVRGLRYLPIELIHSNPLNPRKNFHEEELEELAASLREKGLLQPLVVRLRDDGEYEIVAGERRWRAAQRAGLHELAVMVRDLNDRETLEIAIIENIQRADLNPLEEAMGFQQLIEQFSYTQQQLADAVGKSRSHVANTMRLLTLPDKVRRYIEDGRLTAGHARTLITSDSPDMLAQQIIDLGLSVREAETLVKTPEKLKKNSKTADKDADTRAFEKMLADQLGLKVDIKAQGEGGVLLIHYKSFEQLETVSQLLLGSRGH